MSDLQPSRGLALFLTAILLFLVAPATAQDCARLTAEWPYGPADAVFTKHGKSYFGSGTALVFGDVSDLTNPRVEGSIDLGMLIGDIFAEGNQVTVAAGSFDGGPGGLFVVDVSDPAYPAVSAHVSFALPARSVAVAGDFIFVGLVDPLQPTQGQLLAMDPQFPDGAVSVSLPGWPEELILDGETLWVSELGTGARAFDVSSPLNPIELAFLSGNIRDVDAVDGILYLAEWGEDRDDALRLVDVADPAAPVDLGFYDATRPRRVEVFGRAAYMLSAPSETTIRFEVIDVSPPDDPTRLGILTIGTGRGDLLINDLSVAASIAYLTHSQGGPVVVNTVDATEPRVAGSFDTPGLALGLALENDLLAVAGGGSGLAVVDLAATGNDLPTPTTLSLPFAQDVALADGYAFVASWGDGLLIYDLTDPARPEEVGAVETGYQFFRTVVSGHHLYASYFGNPYMTTAIFDISDPTLPVELSTLQGSVIAVDRGRAYADWSDWLGQCALATWDVSDPANPASEPSKINFWGGCARCEWPWPDYQRSYELDPHRSISGISIHGNLAWVALGQGGLKVLSLSDPSFPTPLANLDIDACGVTGMAAQRRTGYVTTHSPSGLLTVQLTGEDELVQSSFFPLAGFPADAILSGSTVFTANQTAGISAIDIKACQPPLRPRGRRLP